MAYVSVADWKPEQVTEWLKGLDAVILPYIHSFVNNEVDGQQLLSLRPEDLLTRGIVKVGHQEIILEAVEHLRNFHYELDRENVQLLALRLSCQAHSLHRVLAQEEQEHASNSSKVQSVSTQTLADVAGVIACIKHLTLWLDRDPFGNLSTYQELRTDLLAHALNIAISAQRGRFAERPVDEISQHCEQLAKLADKVVQEYNDPLILQPASLDLVTIKKRPGDDVGFYLAPTLNGGHQIIELKPNGPANQSGKIEVDDEIVQVNYQTVVGWSLKAVWPLVQEASTQIFLTLKKRPKHSNVYGQIYFKPYRLPSRKRGPTFIRWHDNLPSPRPELLTIPHFELPLPTLRFEGNLTPNSVRVSSSSDNETSDEDDTAFLADDEVVAGTATSSPSSMRLLLPRPRSAVHRRATVSGASPTNKHPPIRVDEFRAEIQKELQRRGLPTFKPQEEPPELRGKTGSSVSLTVRPITVLGSEKSGSEPKISTTQVSSIHFKLHQSSVAPKGSPPAPQAPKPAPRNNLPTSKPIPQPRQTTSPPIYQVSSPKIMSPPTHQAPTLSSSPSYQASFASNGTHQFPTSPPSYQSVVSRQISPPLTPYQVPANSPLPSPTVRAPKPPIEAQTFQFSNISSPTSPIYGSSTKIPAIVIEGDAMGDCLNERAVDCSPIPPPRPASSLRGTVKSPHVSTPQPTSRNLVARTVSRTKQRLSPKTDRKKASNLLSKGRNVSCKQLGEVECEGWLLQRARAAAGASWNRAWFVLKDSALYGFATPEAKKADKLISLPGFTAAAAPEVKSRQFAFKVYHTGTAFYFAAGCAEELSRWLTSLGAATLGVRSDSSSPYFSETEDEEQPTRPPPRAVSSGNVSGEQHESKGEERRFGSLRRLAGGWRNDEGATSLDRKYLSRILRQEAVVPVPTAQFRSYRRVDRSGNKDASGMDPTHTRTLPSRLGSQNQTRVMSVDSVANAGSTSSLPNPQSHGLQRESIGSSPHLPTVHEPASPPPNEKQPGRIMRLFSPGLSRKFGSGNKPNTEQSLSTSSTAPTLLGSPKLHRALFRGRRQSSQTGKSTAALQPRRIPPTLPEDLPPPVPVVGTPDIPDYPGLEYPPVFEPGTYTLNPEAREQFRTNTSRPRTNRTLMILPKPKDACWPTPQSMHPPRPQERRIRLTPPEAPQRPEVRPVEDRRSSSNQDLVLISSLDLLASTDV